MKPTYRRSWAGNLLMFSDLTLSPSFKVKRWFNGFGELSFRWIQICNGSAMRRSSFICLQLLFSHCHFLMFLSHFYITRMPLSFSGRESLNAGLFIKFSTHLSLKLICLRTFSSTSLSRARASRDHFFFISGLS